MRFTVLSSNYSAFLSALMPRETLTLASTGYWGKASAHPAKALEQRWMIHGSSRVRQPMA